MFRYDIYINGKLYRSVWDESKILDIIRPFDDFEIKEIQL